MKKTISRKYQSIIVSVVFFSVIFLSLTAPRYLSFRELTQKLDANILKITDDKKVNNLDINAIMDSIYKYTYGESHGCSSIEDESYCPEPTDEELSKKYIKWGQPASEYHYTSEEDFRGVLLGVLGANNYYFDRYTQDAELLSVMFNTKNIKGETIMFQLEIIDGSQIITSVLIGETDIFNHSY